MTTARALANQLEIAELQYALCERRRSNAYQAAIKLMAEMESLGNRQGAEAMKIMVKMLSAPQG